MRKRGWFLLACSLLCRARAMRFIVFLPRRAWRFLGPTLVLVASVGHAESAVVEPPSVPEMSLRTALSYAQAHEPGLQAARERLRAAKQEAEVPAAQWSPTFGALAEFVEGTSNNSTATQLSAGAVDLPRIGGTAVSDRAQFRPEATTLLAIGARQEIYDFGRIAAQSAAARALAAISESELRHTRLDLRLAVTNGYYSVRAVREAIEKVRAEHALGESLSASLRPNLSASAALSMRAGGAAASNDVVAEGRGFVPNVPNYSLGVVLNWPFFEPVTQARVRALHAREHALADEVEVARQRAFSRTRQAYQGVAIADAALGALENSVRAARANHEQAEGRFRAGLGTATELADAETLRLDAEVERAIGRFQAATARAELERAIADEL